MNVRVLIRAIGNRNFFLNKPYNIGGSLSKQVTNLKLPLQDS